MLQKLIHVSYLFFFVCTYLGFNLMIGGHFMPKTLLPYIFLILLCGLIPLWKDAMQKIYHKQNIPIFFICFLLLLLSIFYNYVSAKMDGSIFLKQSLNVDLLVFLQASLYLSSKRR